MRRHRRRATAAVALTALLLTGCYSTRLPPISTVGAGFEPTPDERALWAQAREEERQLLAEARVYYDPLLVDYLEEVVAGMTPPGMAANPEIAYRVTVLADPTLNAFAYPHGALFIHTGLLARLENEAQLATVLSHEMTHVERRHMLRHRRSAHNKEVGFAIASVAVAVILAVEAGDAWEDGDYGEAAGLEIFSDLLVGLGLQLAYMAAVNGYGRELEMEADYGAFARLQAAGYDPGQAPAVYSLLREDHGERGDLEAFFFGSHPQLTRRIESAEGWLAAHPEAAPADRERADREEDRREEDGWEFAHRMRRVVRDDAALNLEIGRLEIAAAELERARALMPEDPETHFLTAQLHLAWAERLDGAATDGDGGAGEGETGEIETGEIVAGQIVAGQIVAGDPQAELEAARAALRETIRLDPEHADAHRELGLLAYRQGDYATACTELGFVVELLGPVDGAPAADYVLELERAGYCPGEPDPARAARTVEAPPAGDDG